ncbi:DinB family protein [Chitinophaga alhagiae]|uniref:DinB family protein n=1 Tax=Chitinophaga alhagiae TaxID=2203219 RepID=UPI000E5B0DB4|nr:DinB family protein [Chitinophaga alhagiae]
MKTITFLKTLLLFLVISSAVHAQVTTADMLQNWERAKAYTKAYLDAMPESGYSLKPTPEMRSFAEQMLHLTDANIGFGAAATNAKPNTEGSLEKSADKTKAAVTKQVLDGYDFVINNLKKMTDNQLQEKIKLFGRFELSRQQALEKAFEHQTHHRGQTTVYLRLAKVTPPAEQLF